MFITSVPSAAADFFTLAGSFIAAEKYFPENTQIRYDTSEIKSIVKKSTAATAEPENANITIKIISAKSHSRKDGIRFFFILQKTP